jgi:ATP-dependent protease ClpP protease subunit
MSTPQMILGKIDERALQSFYDEIRDLDPLVNQIGRPFLISSPGGDIGVMLAIYDQIRLTRGITTGTGLLQSSAAVLLQAGTVRRMTRNSLLLFHEPARVKQEKELPGGIVEIVNEIPDQEWTLHTHLVGLVADRTGMSEIEAYDLFDGRFINPERAKNLNLVDEIIDLPVIPVYKEGYFDEQSN